MATNELELDISNITSTQGSIDLVLDTGRNIFAMDDATTVTIPVPGSLEYDASTVKLANQYVLTGRDMLEYYRIAYDPVSGVSVCQLPNGTLFYVKADGSVARIEESGTVMAIGDYIFHVAEDDETRVTKIDLGNGILIDVENGTVSIADDTQLDVVMEAISDAWLDTMGGDTTGAGLYNNKGIVVRLARVSPKASR